MPLTVLYSLCPGLIFCSSSVNLIAIFRWKATLAFNILFWFTGSAHYPVNKVSGSEWLASLCFSIRHLDCSGDAPSRAPPWALRAQRALTPHSQGISQTLLWLFRMKVKQNPSSWDLITTYNKDNYCYEIVKQPSVRLRMLLMDIFPALLPRTLLGFQESY